MFRRRTKADDAVEQTAAPTSPEAAAVDETSPGDLAQSGGTTDRGEPASAEPVTAAPGDGRSGPFDASEVDLSHDDRLDLGALRIRGVPGMELRLEVDESAQQVVAATAVMGDSA